MPWNDSTELLVAGTGQVYFAPYGTPVPRPGDRPTAALNSAFVGAGYNTEDGVSHSAGQETMEVRSWQALQAIRREKTGQNVTLRFTLQQWNENNIPLAFGGGTVTDHGGGIYSYQFPAASESLAERSLVVDAQDGDVHWRFVFPRGTVSEDVETSLQKTDASVLPITFRVLLPDDNDRSWWFLTDAPNFAAGS